MRWLLLERKLREFDYEYKYFYPVNKVNIYIGSNNSRKSFFVRNIMSRYIKDYDSDEMVTYFRNQFSADSFRDFPFEHIKDYNIKKYQIDITALKTALSEVADSIVEDAIRSNYLFSSGIKYFNFKSNQDSNIQILFNEITKLNLSGFNIPEDHSTDTMHVVVTEIENKLNEWLKKTYLENLTNDIDNLCEFEALIARSDTIKKQFFDDKESRGVLLDQFGQEIDERDVVFIPIQRSLRHPEKGIKEAKDYYDKDIYMNRIKSEYDLDDKFIDIFTGLDLYKRYKTALLGTTKERADIKMFETFLSNHFFGGKKISIIPDERSYELKINIEGEEDFPIYNVGDGISNLIILLYNLFLSQRKFIFIEEPEQNIHPALQKLFMRIISDETLFPNRFFFITTHSNHIIDSTLRSNNRTLYHVQKQNNKIYIKRESENSEIFLQSLGVSPSSVFLSNKVIWVEGKYDALIMRALLEAFYDEKKDGKYINKRYVEGVDYVFVPYGGANRVNIDFDPEYDFGFFNNPKEFILKAKNLSKQYLFVMDDDGLDDKKAKKAFFDDISKQLGKNLYRLEAYEIENIASNEVVIEYAANEIKSFNGILPNESNIDRNAVIEYIRDTVMYGSYRNKKLNDYLNEILNKRFGEPNLSKLVGTKEGFTVQYQLKNKDHFYEVFSQNIRKSTSELTPAATKLRTKLYDFISM